MILSRLRPALALWAFFCAHLATTLARADVIHGYARAQLQSTRGAGLSGVNVKYQNGSGITSLTAFAGQMQWQLVTGSPTSANLSSSQREVGDPSIVVDNSYKFYTFCIELSETVSNGNTVLFEKVDLENAPLKGIGAGSTDGLSSSGPMQGAKAGIVRELMGNFYDKIFDGSAPINFNTNIPLAAYDGIGDTGAVWGNAADFANIKAAALQFAIWETVFDDQFGAASSPLSLTDTTVGFYVPLQTTSTGNIKTTSKVNSAIAQAQAWLNLVAPNGVYGESAGNVMALRHGTEYTAGKQDQITFVTPEPASLACWGVLGCLAVVLAKRRVSARR